MSFKFFFKTKTVNHFTYAFTTPVSYQPSPCGWYNPESVTYQKWQAKKIRDYVVARSTHR